MTHETTVSTPLGDVRLAAHAGRLTGLWFEGQKYEHPRTPAGEQPDPATAAVLEQGAHWLENYFAGKTNPETPPLGAPGTPFQRLVWAGLTEIPHGTTASYQSLAAAIGKPAAVRAAAAAVGRNPLSILVPCHRVVGANGALTGFAGGLGRKRALLDLEAGRPLPWRVVAKPYAAQYQDPIAVCPGDAVHFVDRADDGEFAGWKWALAADGRAGWVPRSYFTDSAEPARALRGYIARELSVAAGEEVLELDEFSGWVWAIKRNRDCGWVPRAILV